MDKRYTRAAIDNAAVFIGAIADVDFKQAKKMCREDAVQVLEAAAVTNERHTEPDALKLPHGALVIDSYREEERGGPFNGDVYRVHQNSEDKDEPVRFIAESTGLAFTMVALPLRVLWWPEAFRVSPDE